MAGCATAEVALNPIRLVAVLLMAEGCAEIAMALVYGAFVVSAWRDGASVVLPPGLTTVAGTLAATVLAAGVLKLVAGIRNHAYRDRTLGLVALASGVVPALTCVCAPTSLALLVYGLRVYARPWPTALRAVDTPRVRA